MRAFFLPTRLFLAGIGVSLVLSGSVAPAARNLAVPAADAEIVPAIEGSEFERAPDGFFYVTGLVNGHSIRFLVDTGASVVMLTRKDAATIGLDMRQDAFQSSIRTANGPSVMAWTTLRAIDIAGHRVSRIDAAVPQAGLPVSLLGQNLLRKLGTVTIDGDRLRVHSRSRFQDS